MSEEVTWPFGDQGSGRGSEPRVERLLLGAGPSVSLQAH